MYTKALSGSTVDEFCGKISKSRVWGKVSDRSTIIVEVPEFLYNTVRGCCHAKTSSIRLVVLIQYRLVTDRHTTTVYTALA